MNTFITVLAWTSLIVSALPNFINLFAFCIAILLKALGDKGQFIVGYGFFIWLALGVWPIVYFIIT